MDERVVSSSLGQRLQNGKGTPLSWDERIKIAFWLGDQLCNKEIQIEHFSKAIQLDEKTKPSVSQFQADKPNCIHTESKILQDIPHNSNLKSVEYRFGIFLLEMISGETENLQEWKIQEWKAAYDLGEFCELDSIRNNLADVAANWPDDTLIQLVFIAFSCLNSSSGLSIFQIHKQMFNLCYNLRFCIGLSNISCH